MKFYQAAQSFPPILVRLLARHKGGKPLTTEAISILSGMSGRAISEHEVEALSKATSWAGVQADTMFAYLKGCGLVFDDTTAMRRVTDYLRKNPNFEYLRKSPEWETYYKPMLIRWRSSYIVGCQLPTYPPVRDLVIRLTPILKTKI